MTGIWSKVLDNPHDLRRLYNNGFFCETVCFIPVKHLQWLSISFHIGSGVEIRTFAAIVFTDFAIVLRRLSVMAFSAKQFALSL